MSTVVPTPVQSTVLGEISKSGQTITLITANGFQMTGKIISRDQYTVLIEDAKSGLLNLVYKHAISTIVLPKGYEFNEFKMTSVHSSEKD